MGAGKPYTDEEVAALASVIRRFKIPLPPYGKGVGAWGQTFWRKMADDGNLPAVLVERINNQGNIPRFLAANRAKVQEVMRDQQDQEELDQMRLVLSESDSD